MEYLKKNHLTLLLIALIVIVIFFARPVTNALGAAIPSLTTVGNPWAFTNTATPGGVSLASTTISTFKVGSSGTRITRLNSGTCYIRPYAATIAASSTAKVDCQATAAWNASGVSPLDGVSVGDSAVVTIGTTTAGTTFGGVVLAGASASTTAGYIELTLSNFTGGVFTWPVGGVASGTAAYIISR